MQKLWEQKTGILYNDKGKLHRDGRCCSAGNAVMIFNHLFVYVYS